MRYYWYYEAGTKYFPVQLCTTELAQALPSTAKLAQALPSITLHYSLRKLLPRTTLYYKLAQSNSQYYFAQKLSQLTSQQYCVLQSLHKVPPSATLYSKAWAKYFPVLLWTTNLRNVLPSSTLYYTACIKYFTGNFFFHREAFTHSKFLHTASFYTQKLLDFRQRSPDTEKLLHTANFCTEVFLHSKLSHREAPTQRSFYTETQRSFYTQKPLQQAFAQRSFYTGKFLRKAALHREAFTHSIFFHTANFYTQKHFGATALEIAAPNRISAPKQQERTISKVQKKTKGKSPAPKIRKSADKLSSQP